MGDGKLITFEGIDGSGKSTQLHKLAEYLHQQGVAVLSTREPGGTKLGQGIRELRLNDELGEVYATAELLLDAADRAQHVREVIVPALAAGYTVLSERYYDSTTAYQGRARGLDLKPVADLREISIGGLKPDLTLVFDLDVPTALARKLDRDIAQADDLTRLPQLDREAMDFHERARAAFLEIAARAASRVRLIPAGRSIEAIHQQVVADVQRLFPGLTTTSAEPMDPEDAERLIQAAWLAYKA